MKMFHFFLSENKVITLEAENKSLARVLFFRKFGNVEYRIVSSLFN